MMSVTSMRKLASFCGVLLGVFLVYSITPPLIAEGSGLVGAGPSWVPCYEGQSCYTNMTLYCPDGVPGYGVTQCGGSSFSGVMSGTGLHVHLYGLAYCSSGLPGDGYNCQYVHHSRCQ